LALRDDFSGLNRHHAFKPANFVDLQSIVKNYGILELGLQKIFAIVSAGKYRNPKDLLIGKTRNLLINSKFMLPPMPGQVCLFTCN